MELSDAPATFSAASSSHPPRNTDSLRNTCLSPADSSPHEWLNTTLRLVCCGAASRAEDARKSRLSTSDLAILAGGKRRTHAAASTMPRGRPPTTRQISITPMALSGESAKSRLYLSRPLHEQLHSIRLHQFGQSIVYTGEPQTFYVHYILRLQTKALS